MMCHCGCPVPEFLLCIWIAECYNTVSAYSLQYISKNAKAKLQSFIRAFLRKLGPLKIIKVTSNWSQLALEGKDATYKQCCMVKLNYVSANRAYPIYQFCQNNWVMELNYIHLFLTASKCFPNKKRKECFSLVRLRRESEYIVKSLVLWNSNQKFQQVNCHFGVDSNFKLAGWYLPDYIWYLVSWSSGSITTVTETMAHSN